MAEPTNTPAAPTEEPIPILEHPEMPAFPVAPNAEPVVEPAVEPVPAAAPAPMPMAPPIPTPKKPMSRRARIALYVSIGVLAALIIAGAVYGYYRQNNSSVYNPSVATFYPTASPVPTATPTPSATPTATPTATASPSGVTLDQTMQSIATDLGSADSNISSADNAPADSDTTP